jgi:hypothetical protein
MSEYLGPRSIPSMAVRPFQHSVAIDAPSDPVVADYLRRRTALTTCSIPKLRRSPGLRMES